MSYDTFFRVIDVKRAMLDICLKGTFYFLYIIHTGILMYIILLTYNILTT